MPVTRVNQQFVTRVKRIIVEFGSPIIPISVVFQTLGYTGVTGVEWGLLVGAISATAIEVGYEIEKLGAILVLKKQGEVKPEEVKTNIIKPKSDMLGK